MIYLGADHRGYKLKEKLKTFLKEEGYQFEDLGAHTINPSDDYPDNASLVAQKISEDPQNSQGILVCGSGVGVDIVANKIKGVRSSLVWLADKELVKRSRSHDGANVLALPADYITDEQAKTIVKIWLTTAFSGEDRHKRRLAKIAALENR
jgi:ribose 5-phosphate isomerase B